MEHHRATSARTLGLLGASALTALVLAGPSSAQVTGMTGSGSSGGGMGSSSGGGLNIGGNFGSSGFGSTGSSGGGLNIGGNFGSSGFGSTSSSSGSRTGSSGIGSFSSRGSTGTSSFSTGLGSGSQFGAFGTSGSNFQIVSTINPFYSYFASPFAMGITNSNGRLTAFGAPLYSNLGMTSTTSLGMSGVGGGGFRSGSSLGGSGSIRTLGSTGSSLGSRSGMGVGMMGSTGSFGSTNSGRSIVALDVIGPNAVTEAVVTSAANSPLLADVRGVLARSERLPSRDQIQVALDGDTLVLQGAVGDNYQRRLAEAIIRLTPGVRDVRNDLTVEQTLPTPRRIVP